MEMLLLAAFVGWMFHIHFTQKSKEFSKEFESWLKNFEIIRNKDFVNDLDREYCLLWHQCRDPRNKKDIYEIYRKEWIELLAKRKASGLPEHCPEYIELCRY